MTVVAAAVDPSGTVFMGSDSISLASGDAVRLDTRMKVFRVGEFLFGVTGSHRVCEIVEYLFEPPPIPEFSSSYLIRDFVPALRLAMKEGGGETTSEGQMQMDGTLLGAARGQLFDLDPAYGVLRPMARYHAIGCASQEALAAMFTADTIACFAADDLVLIGLRAAAELDVKIRPPFHVLKQEWTLPK